MISLPGKSVLNGLSLIAIQGANALFPLIAFPYLLGVLGVAEFSYLVIAESLSLYVLVLCIYGFDTSGIKFIQEAIYRNNLTEERDIFFNIFFARCFLWVLGLVFTISISILFLYNYTLLSVIWLLFPLGMILQSNYYYQAVQDNFFLACVVLFSRVSALFLTFYFVNSPDDLSLAVLFLSGSFFVSGIISFSHLLFKFRGGARPKIRKIINLISDGRYLFYGNASVALFRNANVLILAGVSNDVAVAAYSLTEKMIKAIQAVARPLNQIFVPKLMMEWSGLSGVNKTKRSAIKLIWKNTKLQIFLMIVLVLLTFLFILIIEKYNLLTRFDRNVIELILVMVFVVIFGTANAMLGPVGLTLINEQRYLAASVFVVGVTSVVLSLFLSYMLDALGAVIAFVFSEGLLMLLLLLKYYREPDRE